MPEYIYMDGHEEYESYIEVEDIHVQMKRSLGSEKQISVDPISLRDSVSSSSSSGNKAKEELDIFHLKPPSAKPKFLSYSLPNSATSSPKFGMSNRKKAKNHLNQEDPIVRVNNPIYRQNSVALTNLERLREIHLRRSKSCGDGRASIPPEEFDLWPPVKKTNYLEDEGKMVNKEKDAEAMETYDGKFKCGALCLFLPGLGKAKPIRARKTEPEPEPDLKAETQAESGGLQLMVVSKRVSLEKFECGSWRSSAILDDSEGFNKDGSSNLFYELPLEMIHCSGGGSGHVDDTNSPVTSGFVFDKDRKGVLKKNSSRITTPKKKSPDSSRHVRFSFSTSSPKSHPASPTSSCVTPRLLKARDDFNAFLEAQAA